MFTKPVLQAISIYMATSTIYWLLYSLKCKGQVCQQRARIMSVVQSFISPTYFQLHFRKHLGGHIIPVYFWEQ